MRSFTSVTFSTVHNLSEKNINEIQSWTKYFQLSSRMIFVFVGETLHLFLDGKCEEIWDDGGLGR